MSLERQSHDTYERDLLGCERVLLTSPTSRIHEGQISLTHGFAPHQPLMETLPAQYQPWEDLAAQLPELLRQNNEREAIDRLPLLQADNPDDLPDEYLSRAQAMLGNIAHAYYFNQRKGNDQATDPLPLSVRVPWEQVTKRLGRTLPSYTDGKLRAARTHYDTFLCNWRIRHPHLLDGVHNGDITMADLSILNPAFNNNEERVFNLTITLMELRFAPALQYMIAAIKAVSAEDDAALIAALKHITAVLESVTAALDYITPNQHSRNYVDPSVWTKTVAKFDSPVPGGMPGISGSLLPLFHTLDTFIERQDYQSTLGKAMAQKGDLQPQHIHDFLAAMRRDLAQHSLKKYVQASRNPLLQQAYQNFIGAYLGNHGLTFVHATKVYGYMKINFRNGRLETNGGHQGTATVETEPQRQIYDDFYIADDERLRRYLPRAHYATKVHMRLLGDRAAEIILDVSQTAIEFAPGDRCAIFPENTPEEIRALVIDYPVDGNVEVILNPLWKRFFLYELGMDLDSIKLSELLKYIDIRHFKQLSLSAIDINQVRPLTPRLYSVSPLYGVDAGGRVRLTVGKHFYVDRLTQHQGVGVASSYLLHIDMGAHVRIDKVPARNFHLPVNAQIPVLMFAAGTGISPFPGFIEARAMQASHGVTWLLFSAPTHDAFYYKEELASSVRAGVLDLSIIFSRETLNSVEIDRETGEVKFIKKYPGHHVDELIRESAQKLRRLIVEQGAHIYICGNSGFADAVRAGLREIILSCESTDGLSCDSACESYLDRMAADHRLHLDVFTPTNVELERQTQRRLYRSDVAYHNKEDDCWVIINGSVYNLSRFIHVHPGGRKIIHVNAGLDASGDYNHIQHGRSQQIEALLLQYKVGDLSMPAFTHPSLASTYHHLMAFSDALVEMENTLSNNTTFNEADAPVYLWREVYSVLIGGRLANYDETLGSAGSFKYVFGALLGNICETVKLPYKDHLFPLFKQLLDSADQCGMLIRVGSSEASSADLSRIKVVFQMLLQKTIEFIQQVKTQVLAVAHLMEQNQDDFNEQKILELIHGIETSMRSYLALVQHIQHGLTVQSTTASHGLFAVPPASCPFSQAMSAGLQCPVGGAREVQVADSSRSATLSSSAPAAASSVAMSTEGSMMARVFRLFWSSGQLSVAAASYTNSAAPH